MSGYQSGTRGISPTVDPASQQASEVERYRTQVASLKHSLDDLRREIDAVQSVMGQKRAALAALETGVDVRAQAVSVGLSDLDEARRRWQMTCQAERATLVAQARANAEQGHQLAAEKAAMEQTREQMQSTATTLDTMHRRAIEETERCATAKAGLEEATRRIEVVRREMQAERKDLDLAHRALQASQTAYLQDRANLQSMRDQLASARAEADQRLAAAQDAITKASLSQENRRHFEARVREVEARRNELDIIARQQQEREAQLNTLEQALRVKDTQISRREGIVKMAEEKISAT